MFIMQWLLCIINPDNARPVTLKKSSLKDVAVFINLLLTLVKCIMYYQRSMGYEVMKMIRASCCTSIQEGKARDHRGYRVHQIELRIDKL